MVQHPVRLATRADARAAAQLLHDFNKEFDAPTPGPEVLAARLARLLDQGDTFAYLAGSPAVGIALVTLRPNVWFDGPVALLDELYVRPDLRGRTIGTDLIRAVADYCRELGVDFLEVNVDEGDKDALRFYVHHSFALRQPDTGERAFYLTRALG
ncbi:GNAT family N-acetyltransferase [Demequina sp. SYSU T00039]|uniref:GNAT family N-acetyltransferase n=1 Tax=Demequina lignilytica TaxID=3051663 RepID=A0AAW7M3U1_9MICO|nr:MULTISPECIES: GNAT family N-acetyltransferase [unclassified Demequina]MDN4477050.1 GNAT family N-acetyltransferase [Demequina sp. SYSU T00039-1]MDN4487223.1 GNAT family N-acetyltransferase [Demequina sp. SYSU T00039]MDN4491782.1 GNAT family N-acetyltransferase [Demequina sp. SYSU T00068]